MVTVLRHNKGTPKVTDVTVHFYRVAASEMIVPEYDSDTVYLRHYTLATHDILVITYLGSMVMVLSLKYKILATKYRNFLTWKKHFVAIFERFHMTSPLVWPNYGVISSKHSVIF